MITTQKGHSALLQKLIWWGAGVFILALAGLAVLVWFTDPYSGGVFLFCFYALLFFTTAGLFTTLGLLGRKMFSFTNSRQYAIASCRQGIWLGLLAVGLSLLQANELLTLWVALAIVVLL